MKPVCTLVCEDCGKFVVLRPTDISVFKIDDESYAIARCTHCNREKIDEVSEEALNHLLTLNVKVFNWNIGQEVLLNDKS